MQCWLCRRTKDELVAAGFSDADFGEFVIDEKTVHVCDVCDALVCEAASSASEIANE